MKKNNKYLIAGIAVGVSIATAIAVAVANKTKKQVHLFDLNKEQDVALLESILPTGAHPIDEGAKHEQAIDAKTPGAITIAVLEKKENTTSTDVSSQEVGDIQ